MLTVLIVEDELLSRIGLRSLVNWEALGFTLLEDATDGPEALQRIRSQRPDIILLDINIPEMDGLTLMQQIRSEEIGSAVIIISCYEDFETVRKAMKLGAVDYVRKLSLEKEELTNVLQAAKQSLDTAVGKASSLESGPKLTLQLLQTGGIGEQLSPAFGRGHCLYVHVDWKSASRPDVAMLCSVCVQFLKSLQLECHAIPAGEHVYLLVAGGGDKGTAELLAGQLGQTFFADVFIGVSGQWASPDGILACAKSAAQVETLCFYHREKSVFLLDSPLLTADTCPFPFSHYLEKLDTALSSMEAGGIQRVLDELFEAMNQAPYINLELARRMLADLLSRFSICAQTMGGAIEEVTVNQESAHLQSVMEARSLAGAREWFLRFAQAFVESFFTRSKTVNSQILQQAIEYVTLNLSRPIQLGETAKHVNVSSPYLSSLFKRELGENFIPFVNKRKIEEAKKLLEGGKLVYQTSELLGFENSTYFSKVFKKYVGCTPEAYRRKVAGKES